MSDAAESNAGVEAMEDRAAAGGGGAEAGAGAGAGAEQDDEAMRLTRRREEVGPDVLELEVDCCMAEGLKQRESSSALEAASATAGDSVKEEEAAALLEEAHVKEAGVASRSKVSQPRAS